MLGSNGEMRGRVSRYTEMASAIAPVVRRLARDTEFRDDVKVALEAGKKLYDDLSADEPLKVTRKIFTDAEVRKQIDKALLAIEDAGDHVRHARRRNRAWLAWMIAGGIIGGIVALAYSPKTGPTVRRWASNATTMGGASASGSEFDTSMAA